MMPLDAADRQWLTLTAGVVIPYVAIALGAVFIAELHHRRQAKQQAKVKAEAQQTQQAEQVESTAAITAPSEPALVRRPTYCPECVQRAQSNRLTRVLMRGIQALCLEHQRLEDYLPLPDDSYPADTLASRASAQNAQMLIRRIPVQFADPTQAAEAERERQSTGSRILVGEGNGWKALKIYIDPIDPIWN